MVVFTLLFLINGCGRNNTASDLNNLREIIVKNDSVRIINEANEYLKIEPVSITSQFCDRSAGGKNDFYSEGDYWWPNPEDPNGPYIKRDGLSNPNYFKAHRKFMRDMSIQVASLVAAYKLTNDKKYSEHAVKHLTTWFVDEPTMMNPNMEYAQAIKGKCTGRGVGLIDGIHLVEPARAVTVLEKLNGIDEKTSKKIKDWFSQFLSWMTTHEYGIDERERKNNHGTCWVMQAAEYARLTDNKEVTEYCINRYKTVLLPNQMAIDGSYPMELKRTKPYGYSLFNVDISVMVCEILSTPEDNLWNYKLEDGRGMQKGMEFIYPFIKDKSSWPYEPDVMYWDEWPVRHPSLLFAGEAYNNANYIALWESLPHEPKTEEGLRNFPIRQPLLWID